MYEQKPAGRVHVELKPSGAASEARKIAESGSGATGDLEVVEELLDICEEEGIELTAHRMDRRKDGTTIRIEYTRDELKRALANNMEVRPD